MADNFFGPASGDAVLSRPALSPEVPRAGSAMRWFTPCTSPNADDGTRLTSEVLNIMIGNLERVRSGAGIDSGDVTPGSDDVLLESILALVSAAGRVHVGVTDTGTVNAIVSDVLPSVTAWVDGDLFVFVPGATNTTTTPTYAPDGLAAKTVVREDGSALAVGELAAGAFTVGMYRSSIGKVMLLGPTRAHVAAAINDSHLFAGAGYQRLPSSLILQWATGTVESPAAPADPTQTITWPIAFPNAVHAAYVSTNDPTSAATIDRWYQIAGAPGLTSVTVISQYPSGTVSIGSCSPTVFAIGH